MRESLIRVKGRTKPGATQATGLTDHFVLAAKSVSGPDARVQIALCSISGDRMVVSLAGNVGLTIPPEAAERIGLR